MRSVECGSCDGIGAVNVDSGWKKCKRCKATGKLEIELQPEHFGRYAFICSSCDTLHFFKGTPMQEKSLRFTFRKAEKMKCPSCGHLDEITEDNRRMMQSGKAE